MSKKSFKSLKESRGDIINDNIGQLEQLSKTDSHKISLAAQYEDKLSNLELEDLKELARELGIALGDNREILIKAIRKEFKKK
jgi:hypothetical protein